MDRRAVSLPGRRRAPASTELAACYPPLSGRGQRDKVMSARGSGAVVAHHLAKVRVAGSNPVFRSRNLVF